ncbi:MAG: calcium/sodium antiporter [Rhodobacteraceae bacterium]|nr:calcium/sodium antiporter [Paracoccaceae bacterium]
MAILLVVAGLLLLVFAGDLLVKGAVALSLRLGVPTLIVSVTIVGFGTSAPEMLIAIQSALEGVPGLALGNVVGSNTANVLLVLGVPALLFTLDTSTTDTRRIYMVMMGVSVIFVALAFMGPLHFWHAAILLGLLALMLWDNLRTALASRSGAAAAEKELSELAPDMPGWRVAAYIMAGVIGLPLGAQLMIEGALVIAEHYAISPEIIGLTLVAVGTSLPELATTTVAALRREAEVALGNVIGSNMFNLLAIMGVTSLFGPLPVAPQFLQMDLWIMLGASALVGIFVFSKLKLTRLWGVLFLGLYVGYTVFLLGR